MAPIITLLTDFGSDGPYVGAMKGAILSINPQATIVDLTHDVPPGDVFQGAFLLFSAISTFPADAIHLAVVDPGVGSNRRPIALQTERGMFVAPDNGLLSFVVGASGRSGAGSQSRAPEPYSLEDGQRVVHLLEPRFWRHPVSRTFHGRDIFAPVAAHLSLGAGLDDLGNAVDQILAFPLPHAVTTGPGEIVGEVVFVDRFGNLVTCIRDEDVQTSEVRVEIGGRTIDGLSLSYEEGAGLLAIFGSGGLLEIAVTNGSASRVLGAGVGTLVRVRAE